MKESKALIFDIKRFALHDGSGIRTTVFFKGCPLHCLWCQNPEGLSIKRNVMYFENRCIHCKRCVEAADDNQLSYHDRPYICYDYDNDIDDVINACPSNALIYDSKEYNVETLFEKIKEDEVFFKHGGGITLSGGEPFLQHKFLYQIVKKCKEAGFHIAIETSLFVDSNIMKRILPYLDLIYVDFKLFDDLQHQLYTGVSNQLIKENITYLLTSEYKDSVIVRTPLIPTISATDQNISDIVTFLINLYPDVTYELLNYNPLAPSKYEFVGLTYGLKEKYEKFSAIKMQHFYDLVYQNGLKNLVIE